MDIPPIHPRRLLVFAGAGLSMSAPSGLPGFIALRDGVLVDLGLEKCVPPWEEDPSTYTGTQSIVSALEPELFMEVLRSTVGRPEVETWLTSALSQGSPNAGHLAVAQLFRAGAHVWTVNFDRMIETATQPPLPVVAAPAVPGSARAVLKPHGTLGGELAVTARDALRALPSAWRERLRHDLGECDMVVFIGYRGQDLDFMPEWDALIGDRQVLWFDLADADRERRRRLLPTAESAGTLHFPEPSSSNPAMPNPTYDFVEWCNEHGWTSVPADLIATLAEPRTKPQVPNLGGDLDLAAASVLAYIGQVRPAAARYLSQALKGEHRRDAIRAGTRLLVDHGGGLMAAALAGTEWAQYVIARLAHRSNDARRDRLRRKRASIRFNQGRHAAVLALTEGAATDRDVTLRVLRAGSLRYSDDLAAAVRETAAALGVASKDGHPIRCANAALQFGYALLWSGDFTRLRAMIPDQLRPYANVAAARWVAWADTLEASCLIQFGETAAARALLDRAILRFGSEGLIDGLIAAQLTSLVAYRQADDRVERAATRRALTRTHSARTRGTTFLTRSSRFRLDALWLEDAEFSFWCRGDATTAVRLATRVAQSPHPLQSASGHLCLAAAAPDRGDRADHARFARAVAERLGARFIAEQADVRLRLVDTPAAMPQVFLL